MGRERGWVDGAEWGERDSDGRLADVVVQIKADRNESGKDTKEQIKELQEEAKKTVGK